MNKNKKIILAVCVIAVAGILGYLLINRPAKNQEPVTDSNGGIQLCFYRENITSSKLIDKTWLTMYLKGTEVTGELHNIPAEKDSKRGPFIGSVGDVDKMAMARTADVWWETTGEGITNKEQLSIIFGEGVASVGFGEMVDRGDGIYVYKDINTVDYSLELNDVSCEDLFEKIVVEDYIRKNISTISTKAPVLGGSWYVVSVDISTSKDTATVVYEDGHVQESEKFKYTQEGNTVNIVY